MSVSETKILGGIHHKREFTGLSSDTKPIIDIPHNSKFKECDTKKKFIWNGASWIEDIDNIEQDIANINTALAERLVKFRYLPYAIQAGQALGGATISGFVLTIPSGQTGNNGYLTTDFDISSIASLLVGKRIKVELRAEFSSAFLSQISSIYYDFNVIRNRVTASTQALTSSSTTINTTTRVYTFEYIVTSGDTKLKPYIMVFNSKGALATQETLTISDATIRVIANDNKLLSLEADTINVGLQSVMETHKNNPYAHAPVIVEKTVKPDGTGDYLSPYAANNAITDATVYKQYNVIIYPGTYTDQLNWYLKPYIHLTGIDRETCWLKGELPDDATDSQIENTSTFWMTSTNKLTNLKVTCKNMRYPVHDESSNTVKDWTKNIRNCIIEHYGNDSARAWRTAHPESGLLAANVWTSETAWGYGSSSGAEAYYEDCTFRSPFGAWYVHNNSAFEKPCIHHLTRCKIECTKPTGLAIRIQSLGSRRNDKVYLDNCEIIGQITQDNNPWVNTSASAQVANKHEIDIVASGCTPAISTVGYTGKALKIASSNTTGSSTVRVEGDAVTAIFGDVAYKDGDGGMAGYCYGSWDISGVLVGLNSDTQVNNTIGRRLGDCTSVNKTLTVTFQSGSPVTITFNQNYTVVTNATLLTTINTALGANGTASEMSLKDYPELYSPVQFLDHFKSLKNVGAVYIPKGYAVAYSTNYMSVRLMTSTDPIKDFVGIAMEDIIPNAIGKIQTKGYFRVSGVVFGDKIVIDGTTAGKPIVNNSATDWIAKGLYSNYIGFNL